VRHVSELAKRIGARRGAPVALSLVAHSLLIAAATRIAWHVSAPASPAINHVVWLDRSPFPAPANPFVPETPVEVLNPPGPPESREPPSVPPAEPTRSPRPRRSQRAPVAPPEPAEPAEPAEEAELVELAPSEPPPPRGVDFEAERARAVAEAVEARTSAATLRRPTVDELLAPRAPARVPPRHKPTIFDLGGGGGRDGPSLARPGQARTAFARKLIDFCHALTGGFGLGFQGHTFFSLCAKPNDEPTGLFPEVMPEYLKLKPECTDVEPVRPLLPEARRFPTAKCRLVPKDAVPADVAQ
jgi:hypothetical protein